MRIKMLQSSHMTEQFFRYSQKDYMVDLPDDVQLPVHVFLQDLLAPWNVILRELPVEQRLQKVFWFNPKEVVYVAYLQRDVATK